MVSARQIRGFCQVAGLVAVGLVAFVQVGSADYFTVILQGNVVMPDGSPPPRAAGIQRECSDYAATSPGPLTDKKGHYIWRMDLDPENTRVCTLYAGLAGFSSTHVDIANFSVGEYSQNKMITVPDIVLSPRDSGGAKSVVLVPIQDAPGKAQAPYKAAVKALDANETEEGIKQLLLAVQAVPKFADGWVILGQVYEQHDRIMEARDVLLHAIAANPKLASPYLRLARISNKLGDWNAAAKNEDALIKIEDRYYPEVYLEQGITRFELKDLAGAEQSLKTAQSLDPLHKFSRSEYVLGMVALAKGDVIAAKEHLAQYIKLDPNAPDIERIQAQHDSIGTPDAPKLDITLERP
jgi:Tfp pilus assembly protein PilF